MAADLGKVYYIGQNAVFNCSSNDISNNTINNDLGEYINILKNYYGIDLELNLVEYGVNDNFSYDKIVELINIYKNKPNVSSDDIARIIYVLFYKGFVFGCLKNQTGSVYGYICDQVNLPETVSIDLDRNFGMIFHYYQFSVPELSPLNIYLNNSIGYSYILNINDLGLNQNLYDFSYEISDNSIINNYMSSSYINVNNSSEIILMFDANNKKVPFINIKDENGDTGPYYTTVKYTITDIISKCETEFYVIYIQLL